MALPKIDLPTYELVLPSSKRKIKYRPFTVKEEKILLMLEGADSVEDINQILRQVLENCTFGEIDSYEIPMVDTEYLFINIRGKSVAETIDYTSTCKKCKLSYELSLPISDIKVSQLPESNVVQLSDNLAVEMRFPSQSDENKVSELNLQDKVMSYMHMCMNKIFMDDETYDTKDMTESELIDFVDSLPGKCAEKMIKFFAKVPYCYISQEITCPQCETKTNLRLEGLGNFFVI